MIRKIAHIADVHFRNIQRHIEFRAVCSNFIDQMKKIQPDRIVIAGDIVHSRNQISPELVSEVSWFFTECSRVAQKVIIIPGNHDIVEQNKERMDALTPIIGALGLNNIYYYTKSESIKDENVIWAVYSIFDNHMAPGLIDSLDKKIIGLFHGVINGAVNETGFKFAHGSDVDKFDICDITLCGDIHKRQILTTTSGRKVIYPGSLIQQNFGETVSEHGFGILDLTDMSYKFHDIENPVKYLTFKITDFSDIEEGSEMFTNA